MKALKTLVKLHQKQLDDVLRQIGLAEKQKLEIEQALAKILTDAKREFESYNTTKYAFMLEQYMHHARFQEKSCKKEIAMLEYQIKILRDELFDKFTELKKLELVLERRQKAYKAMVTKREDKTVDEITVLRHKRLES